MPLRPLLLSNQTPDLKARRPPESDTFPLRDSSTPSLAPPYAFFDEQTESHFQRQNYVPGAQGRVAYTSFGVSPLEPPEPSAATRYWQRCSRKKKQWLIAGAVATITAVAVGIGVGVSEGAKARARATASSFYTDFSSEGAPGWSVIKDRALGASYRCGFAADAVTNGTTGLTMRITDETVAGKPFGCGEVLREGLYGYGTFSVAMQPFAAAGVTTSMVLYAEQPSGISQEMDLTILGSNPTDMLTTVYRDGKPFEKTVSLGFDATKAIHTYSLRWTKQAVTWSVDGVDKVQQTFALPRYAKEQVFLSTWLGQANATANGYPADAPLPPSGSSRFQWFRYDKLRS